MTTLGKPRAGGYLTVDDEEPEVRRGAPADVAESASEARHRCPCWTQTVLTVALVLACLAVSRLRRETKPSSLAGPSGAQGLSRRPSEARARVRSRAPSSSGRVVVHKAGVERRPPADDFGNMPIARRFLARGRCGPRRFNSSNLYYALRTDSGGFGNKLRFALWAMAEAAKLEALPVLSRLFDYESQQLYHWFPVILIPIPLPEKALHTSSRAILLHKLAIQTVSGMGIWV